MGNNAFTVSPMFTDHMVLQREQDIVVWGTGQDGRSVKAFFLGQTFKTDIYQGYWQINLGIHDGGGPHELLLACETERVRFSDILIGEVWLAAGQSNMEHPLFQSYEWESDKESFDLSCMRLFTIPRRPFPNAVIDGWHFDHTLSEWSDWELCTPQNVERFSAIGAYFGQNLTKDLDVPVGIISCNWGGTAIESWMGKETLLEDKELAFLIDDYERTVKNLEKDDYEAGFEAYQEEIRKYAALVGDPVERIKQKGLEHFAAWHPVPVPTPPMSPLSFQRPCGLYDNMLVHTIPYSLKGVLWYQGESNGNVKTAPLYEKLFKTMIRDWRSQWGRADLFFAIVQLSSFGGSKQKHNLETWPLIRQAQLNVSRTDKNTSLIVSADYGDKYNIHPLAKKPLGVRLAQSVLHKVYGKEETYRVISYDMVRKEGAVIILEFPEPLEIAKPDFPGARKNEPPEFELCGEDGIFYSAECVLLGREIRISCEKVSMPTGVAYGWSKRFNPVLYGISGLPVTPFRVVMN